MSNSTRPLHNPMPPVIAPKSSRVQRTAAPPRSKAQWKRTTDEDGSTSWWLNRGPLCFCVYFSLPERGQRKATVELTAWTSDCDDEPAVSRTLRFDADLASFLPCLPHYQQALISETAEVLEAKAASVRALLS